MRVLLIIIAASSIVSCSSDKVNPFKPLPECKGVAVTPFMGDRQLVISQLSIADANEGFDLNLDGKKDNKLAPLGAIANPTIANSFTKKHDIVLPIEIYGYNGEATTTCTKFAFYIGKFNQDRDGDKNDTSWDTRSDGTSADDCLDTDPAVNQSATENLTNRLDDDCDGYADNATRTKKPTDTQDLDGDGYTLAMGDCDDRADTPEHKALAATRHPGAVDVCDDGIDQNCDGIPDNDPMCDPFAQNDVTLQVTALSLDAMMNPLIEFKDGHVTNGVLAAGPDLFSLSVPFRSDSVINLQLSGARVTMALSDDSVSKKTNVMTGVLGGVLEAVSLAQITNINAGGVIKPDQSLLDAVFVGAAAPILGLDSDRAGHYLPDIDVDGDGLESFWLENPMTGVSPKVDTCRDGDGTIVRNNFDGKGTICALAKDAKGNYRFVDGLSVAIKFSAVPAKLGMVVPK